MGVAVRDLVPEISFCYAIDFCMGSVGETEKA